jgi:hypothetical protein
LNNIRGLAWEEGDKLTLEVKIWSVNKKLCRGMQMKNLQFFRKMVAWTLPNLSSCLEVEIGEGDADEESANALCYSHKFTKHPESWDYVCHL